jgi:hypothetical protein
MTLKIPYGVVGILSAEFKSSHYQKDTQGSANIAHTFFFYFYSFRTGEFYGNRIHYCKQKNRWLLSLVGLSARHANHDLRSAPQFARPYGKKHFHLLIAPCSSSEADNERVCVHGLTYLVARVTGFFVEDVKI